MLGTDNQLHLFSRTELRQVNYDAKSLMPTDIRNAARGLLRTPTVTGSAILCLTLGLGATTAIASAIDRALVRPLPFSQPDRLLTVYRTAPQANDWPTAAAKYLDAARATRQLSALGAAASFGVALLTNGDRAEQVCQTVSAFSKERLATAMDKVFQADRALRDARPDDRIVMEELVLSLTA